MTKNIYEELVRINKELGRKPKYDAVLVHPSVINELPKQEPLGHLFGIPVIEDPFLKPGEYRLMPYQESWKPTLKFEKPPFELNYGGYTQRFLNEIARAFAIPSHYFEEPPYRWQRYMNEALLKWGSRLFERGLLDDPEIRWEYQKTILSTPVKWWNKLFAARFLHF